MKDHCGCCYRKAPPTVYMSHAHILLGKLYCFILDEAVILCHRKDLNKIFSVIVFYKKI